MSTGEIREVYGRELVNLRNERRWSFLNTLFSVSEAVMYMQASSMQMIASTLSSAMQHIVTWLSTFCAYDATKSIMLQFVIVCTSIAYH